MKRILVALLCTVVCMTAAQAPGQAPAAKAKSAQGIAAATDAEALYNQMVAAWREADSIYYESEYQATGAAGAKCSYKVWLKKPNYVLLEATQDGKPKGTIVGDGSVFLVSWQGKPPQGYTYDQGVGGDADTAGATSYTTHAAPAGKHSVAADAGLFGIGLTPISDPSMFSGAPDPWQRSIASGRIGGTETLAGEKCDVLNLTYSKGQGEATLWLSQQDHLPRKERQVLTGKEKKTVTETWSSFELNGDIDSGKFAAAPKSDWLKVVKIVRTKNGLLPAGVDAPQFSLAGFDGKKVTLSDYKGKVVWLHIWFAG